jgi:integrase
MSLYKRGGKWWFHFELTQDGRTKHYQRSAKTGDRNLAEKRERTFRVRIENAEFGIKELSEKKPDLTIGQLLDGLEADFKLRGIYSARNRSNIKLAREAFTSTMKAADLTTQQIDSYIEKRIREKYAPASTNRMVGLVSQAFKLAIKRGDIERAPQFRHLSEAGNEREGFFEADEFAGLLDHLPDDLKDFCRFAYTTGWRKGEIASIRWSDIEGDVVRLRGENSKNGEARSIVLTGELAQIIERRRQARVVRDGLTHFVFHRDGAPVREFRKAWASACKKAGLSGKLFHDFRRSSVRDMIRSGVPQSIAMKISGHKTASMFRRYDIASEDDLREAMERVERYHEAAQQKLLSIAK